GDWLYEIKFDGYRALAFKDGKDVRLVSRNKKAFDYPQLLDALKKSPARHLILDGEIAALDEQGRSSASSTISLLVASSREPSWTGLIARKSRKIFSKAKQSNPLSAADAASQPDHHRAARSPPVHRLPSAAHS